MSDFEISEAIQPFAAALRGYLKKFNAIAIPEGFIETLIENPKVLYDRGDLSLFQLGAITGVLHVAPENSQKKIKKHLLSQFNIKQTNGDTISSPERHDWNVREQLLQESYYWDRLRNYWENTDSLPYHVINSVDQVTDEILELCGNPQEQGNWLFRGLVMGSVQSGKTTNYSALIAKAFDVGYGHVVVLAGLTNSLREQTQERMDQTIVGQDSRFQDIDQVQAWHEIKDYGKEGAIRQPASRTSIRFDFRKQANQQGQELEDTFKEPTLFVIKKNPTVLKNLHHYLKSLGANDKLKKPLLLIDDEADNASVNTKKSQVDATRINKEIRKILATAERRSYVGYTATPFANIFIDPNFKSDDALVEDDLFPKHFIKALDWPDNYVGAHNLFGDENPALKQACVWSIEDIEASLPEARSLHETVLPVKHKKEHPLDELPWALEEAILSYILFSGIQELGDRRYKHSSMLINISRFNLVQTRTHQLVEHFWRETFDAINSDILKNNWVTNPVLARLHQAWLKYNYDSYADISFDEVREALAVSTRAIEIKIVNMQGGGLEYPEEKRSDRGKRYITIGGLALSRGLTLEGLAVSYVVRNIGAQDTLLQTARWFGYRNGYDTLCRVFLTDQLIEQFEEANSTIEELREELKIMRAANRTPNDFGLKVRHSEIGLAITARQKMWSADPIQYSADYELKQVQIHQLFNDSQTFNSNEEKILKFLSLAIENKITDPRSYKPSSEASDAVTFRSRCLDPVIQLLDSFDSPLANMQSDVKKNQHCMISDYINDRRLEMEEWEIVIPFKTNKETKSIAAHVFDKDKSISEISDVLRESKANNKNNTAQARTRSNLKIESGGAILAFDNRSVADAPKSDLVHSFSEEFVKNHITPLVGSEIKSRGSTTATEILKFSDRPILLIQLIQPEVSNKKGRVKKLDDINLGDSGLITTLTLAFPKTKLPPVVRRYHATIRLQELLRQEALEESDDTEEENDE